VIEIRQYIDRLGLNPFERWFEKLDNDTQARIAVFLDRLERGNFSAAKGVGAGVLELRLDFGWRAACDPAGRRRQKAPAGRHRCSMRPLEGIQEPKAGRIMPLTKSFNDTIKSKLLESEGFRRALLREAVGCMISGDVETGKSVLRKYINGTVGFVKLGADLGRSPKALMRMFSSTGNPQAKNLFEIVAYLQKLEGTVLEVIDRAAA
jgi:hypothetical protein